jgi:hypothetical protein
LERLSFPPAKALIIKALLDSDLEEGKGISVRKDCWICGINIVFKLKCFLWLCKINRKDLKMRVK